MNIVTMASYAEIEAKLNKFPLHFKYKCTADNRDVTRNIQNLNKSELMEIKEKLEKELNSFESLYEEHNIVDKELVKMINEDLEEIKKDPKKKKDYTDLKAFFESAKNDKTLTYRGRDRTNFQSVQSNNVYKKMQRFHQHKVQYTNMFHGFIGDTVQVLKNTIKKRLDAMITPEIPVVKITEEEQKTMDLKNAIASVDFGDEEW